MLALRCRLVLLVEDDVRLCAQQVQGPLAHEVERPSRRSTIVTILIDRRGGGKATHERREEQTVERQGL